LVYLSQQSLTLHKLQLPGYYCVAGGASSFHTISHMREAIQEKNFQAKVTDVTHELGVLSLQGR
jgi:sarcosine dehydrogenase